MTTTEICQNMTLVVGAMKAVKRRRRKNQMIYPRLKVVAKTAEYAIQTSKISPYILNFHFIHANFFLADLVLLLVPVRPLVRGLGQGNTRWRSTAIGQQVFSLFIQTFSQTFVKKKIVCCHFGNRLCKVRITRTRTVIRKKKFEATLWVHMLTFIRLAGADGLKNEVIADDAVLDHRATPLVAVPGPGLRCR